MNAAKEDDGDDCLGEDEEGIGCEGDDDHTSGGGVIGSGSDTMICDPGTLNNCKISVDGKKPVEPTPPPPSIPLPPSTLVPNFPPGAIFSPPQVPQLLSGSTPNSKKFRNPTPTDPTSIGDIEWLSQKETHNYWDYLACVAAKIARDATDGPDAALLAVISTQGWGGAYTSALGLLGHSWLTHDYCTEVIYGKP
jgi:hypothetical protein